MAKQTKAQQAKVERVMHEFKEGDLKSGSGRKVKDRKQAVAIALSEAGASNQKTPAQNRRAAAKSRTSGNGGPTKAELYERAKKRNVPGRSKMDKDELARALA